NRRQSRKHSANRQRGGKDAGAAIHGHFLPASRRGTPAQYCRKSMSRQTRGQRHIESSVPFPKGVISKVRHFMTRTAQSVIEGMNNSKSTRTTSDIRNGTMPR